MYTEEILLEWQRDQYSHDMRNHFDILSLHKQDRLKHYAMHFAKYAGRIARGDAEEKPLERTFTDALLVCLCTANTLHQRLHYTPKKSNREFFFRFTDAAGRVNDAAEKIDHLETFVEIARDGNQDILDALLDLSLAEQFNVDECLSARRSELKARQFFIR